MPTTSEPRFFASPRSDAVERGFSAAAFALFLGAWVVAYVGIMPADPVHHRHAAALQVRP